LPASACPSELDWQDAAWLHEFLEQFSDATKAFSADRHPTAHMFLKMMMAIRDELLDEAWNANSLLNELADAMYLKFEKYWAAPSIILLIATTLDPSMKADFVKFYFTTVESAQAEENMRELRRYLNQYYLEYERIVRNSGGPAFTSHEEEVLSQGNSSSSSRLHGKRVWNLHLHSFHHKTRGLAQKELSWTFIWMILE